MAEAIATSRANEGRREVCKYLRNDHDTTFEQAKVMHMSATILSHRSYSYSQPFVVKPRLGEWNGPTKSWG